MKPPPTTAYTPITNSNNSITNGLESSSSVSLDKISESQPEQEEDEEEISPLFEHISETNPSASDDDEATESHPAVVRNSASSSIGVTQATRQPTLTIPSRPGSEKQARCDALAEKLRRLRPNNFVLTNEATVIEQNNAIRDLVGRYSDEDIDWILTYTRSFSPQYRGMTPGPHYASILLKVAPEAMSSAMRQLVETYSNDDLAWIQVYAASFSQYKGMKPGPEYAAILLEVAPDAMAAAADPEVRKMLVQSANLAPASSPPPSNGRAMQRATEPDKPRKSIYSDVSELQRMIDEKTVR